VSRLASLCWRPPRWSWAAALVDIQLMKTAILLIISNIFMTFAWYGHLKFKERRVAGHSRQLADRIRGILFSGARESNRQQPGLSPRS
jgi:hypothetical protein